MNILLSAWDQRYSAYVITILGINKRRKKKPHLRCFNYLAQSIILYFKFFAMKKNKETSVEGYVRFIRNKGSQYVTRIVAKKQATYAGRKCKAKYIWLFPCQI